MSRLAALAKLSTWFSVGARRIPEDWTAWVIALSSTTLTLYVLVCAFGLDIDHWLLAATFLAAFIALSFLMVGARTTSDTHHLPWWDLALAAVSIGVGVYFAFASTWLHDRIPLMDALPYWDKMFGTLLLILLLEASRRVLGLGVMTLALLFIAYALWGRHLGVFGHGRITYTNLIDVSFFTSDGVLGIPLTTAARYAFLFMLFGTVLRFARAGAFFCDLASAMVGRLSGAPAKIAVISSGLNGMVAGSASLDVAATGAINIPTMKRHKYPPAVAGAIELTAAAGGAIMPPAMGSAAFVMMAYAGLGYRELAAAAFLPALLYYIAVYAQTHFYSRNHNPQRLSDEEIPHRRLMVSKSPQFAIPILTVIAGLLLDFAPNRVAAIGIAVAIVMAARKKASRFGWLDMLRSASDTVLRMMPVTIACATAGLLIAVINITGLGAKFAELIYALTGDNSFVALVIAAVLTTLFGMGMPTPAAYILSIVLMGPVLQNLGVPDLASNMFILCFAALSAVTPPMAAASYVAAAIAHSDAHRISIRAVRLALAAFVMPFAFISSDTLLMQGDPWRIVLDFITAALGFVVLAAGLEGNAKLGSTWWERALLCAGGLFLVAPPLWANPVGLGFAAASIASVYVRSMIYPAKAS
jgi:TRAP transporter 4TM/12TM fusion protein